MVYSKTTWVNVTPGTTPPAGTPATDAAHLQNIEDGIAAFWSANSRTAAFTLTTNSTPKQLCDASAGAFMLTLPPSPVAGWEYVVIKTDTSANVVTVAPSAGTINGAASYALSAPYQYVRVVYTGTGWVVDGSGAGGTTGTLPLYKRATFGAYYNVTTAGGYGNSLYDPTNGSAQAAWETALGISVPRVVFFAGFDAAIPAGASYYPNRRLVRAWDVEYYPGPNYTEALVPFSGILAGTFDSTLNSVFSAHAARAGGTDFRMWWEMNLVGTQSSPGYNGGLAKACTSTQQFIDTWRYVVNYARAHFPAATTGPNPKFRFCYIPNGTDSNTAIAMEKMWPGSTYVDVVGVDTYNETVYSTWQTFEQKLQPVYDRLIAMVTKYPGGYDAGESQTPVTATMPFMIGETGSTAGGTGQSIADFWTSVFTTTKFPLLQAVDLFNTNTGTDWRIDSTAASATVATRYLAPGAA